MAKLTCPSCSGTGAEKEITFRCGGPGREPVRDKLNDSTPMPPEVPGDDRKLSAACSRCGNPSTLRICPHCHSRPRRRADPA